MSSSDDASARMSPFAVAAAGWALPGLGYLLVGGSEAWRGLVGGGAVLALFVAGLFIGGVRVVDLPGYEDGRRVVTRDGSWTLTRQPVASLFSRPWFVAQALAGPTALAAGYGGVSAAAAGYPKPTARLADIGTLYCAAAGMLNLMLILDASARTKERA